MPIEMRTEIVIAAPIRQVWEVLGELERYPEWNPRLNFRKPAVEGKRMLMKVRVGLLPLFVPVVLARHREDEELAWVGGPSWLMSGYHYFRLEAVDDAHTRLIQGERFTGALAPLVHPLVRGTLQRLYHDTNELIRARIEDG